MGQYKNWRWDDVNLYEAKDGDTFDGIALLAYGDERLSSILIQENPAYNSVLRFRGGEIITIPIINLATSARVPPWKRGA